MTLQLGIIYTDTHSHMPTREIRVSYKEVHRWVAFDENNVGDYLAYCERVYGTYAVIFLAYYTEVTCPITWTLRQESPCVANEIPVQR